MSDLEQTRNHARKMSESAHRYGCYGKAHNRLVPRPGRPLDVKDCPDDDPHEAHAWRWTLTNGTDTIRSVGVRLSRHLRWMPDRPGPGDVEADR